MDKIKTKGRIEIDNELCKACKFCMEACPKKLISEGLNLNNSGFLYFVFFDPLGICNACKLCGIVCPETAIEVFKDMEGPLGRDIKEEK